MICRTIAFLAAFGLLCTKAEAHGHHHHHHDHFDHDHDDEILKAQHRHLTGVSRCGTHTPNFADRLRAQKVLDGYTAVHGESLREEQLITIPTIWHSIRKSDGSEGVSDQAILDAIAVLNGAYASSGFEFALQGNTTTDNDSYYFAQIFTQAEFDMKSALRQGDASTLNIYSSGVNEINSILGFGKKTGALFGALRALSKSLP